MRHRPDAACGNLDLEHITEGFLDEQNSFSIVRPIGTLAEPTLVLPAPRTLPAWLPVLIVHCCV